MHPIVEKIRKLLALSTSSNPHEAALAAAMAQELMVKYAIEESQLAPEQRTAEPVEVEQMNVGTRKIPKWLRSLAYVMSKGFFVQTYTVPGRDVIVVGRASDRAAFIATFNFVRAELERLCEAGWNTLPDDREVHGKTWKVSFMLGAVVTIRDRLAAETLKLNAAEPGTAIVLANRALAVQDYMKQQNIKLRQGQGSRIKSYDGFGAGKKAGWKVSLDKRASKQIGGAQ